MNNKTCKFYRFLGAVFFNPKYPVPLISYTTHILGYQSNTLKSQVEISERIL